MSAAAVYIVDDDPSVRRSLQRLLSREGYEIDVFPAAAEFLEAYDGQRPGCLILDLCLPGPSGLEVLERLEHSDSPLCVVFLSGHGDVTTTVAAMKHGALDFLTKPFDESAFLSVVASAFQRSTIRWAERQAQAQLRHRFNTLTPREREVCMLVAAGYLNKQTAFELGTAEKTVKVHRARVMSKLQVASVAELVRLVDHLGPTTPNMLAAEHGAGREVYTSA